MQYFIEANFDCANLRNYIRLSVRNESIIQCMRTILHCDANNFYASVECMLDSSLKGKAVAVCGDPAKRHGIVLAKNELAKSYGVKTAETIHSAMSKCPNLVLVPPHFEKYVEISDKIFDIYTQYTDKVEPFGIDECWLDVTGSLKLMGSGKEIADKIRERVKREIGITVSVGVSFTKVFAKLGSDMKKPDATTVISKDDFKQTIWPLPVGELLMIGKKTQAKLQSMGVNTIGDLANTDIGVLRAKFGINGDKLRSYAMGEESSDVREYYNGTVHKSVGNSTTMPRDVSDKDECVSVISMLCETIAGRLRKGGYFAQGVSLSLRYNDLTHMSKQAVIPSPTHNSAKLREYAAALLDKCYNPERDLPLRGIGVAAFSLTNESAGVQLNMFDNPQADERIERLDKTIDKIRSKYGFNSIKYASSIKDAVLCYDLEDGDDDGYIPFKK